MEKKKYPIGAEYYILYEEVGHGVSACVRRAQCIPFDEVVAIKILDFERDNCDLNNVYREAQTMVLVDHPNVLKSHCSFVSDHNLWVVMPYMSGGSCLHILKAAYPDGFEEVVIATVLREVLKGLEYLHHHGHIHRDVKAGNILIESRGGIKLGDFGVSACIFESGDRQRMRNTFVGTPCWMAPEVMEQLHGYDFKADIWSFGITALELAHGHAPFSKYPPMKVLLMTLQNAPPGLDYERDRKFSKSFKQMIASCLVKDPSKRPSAKKLLKHSFFKQARSNDYITRTLLDGLPALGDRIQALKRKEEDMLAQKKMADGQKEELSQNEYKRGISEWNFNLEDVKAQASLIQDEDVTSETQGWSSISLPTLDGQEKQLELHTSSQATYKEDNDLIQNQPTPFAAVEPTINIAKVRCERSDDDSSVASPSYELNMISPRHGDHVESNASEKPVLELNGKFSDNMIKPSHQREATLGNTTTPETIVLPVKGESDKSQNISGVNGLAVEEDTITELPSKASTKSSAVNSDELDEKAKPPVVQQKGRFKVTSENVQLDKVAPSSVLQKNHSMQVGTSEAAPSSVLQKSHSMQAAPSSVLQKSHSMQVGTLELMGQQHPLVSVAVPADAASSSAPATAASTPSANQLFPLLQSVLQTNILQRDNILNLMKQVSVGDSIANRPFEGANMPLPPNVAITDKSLLEAAQEKEKELLHEISELQWRLICAQEEIQKYKTDNAQKRLLAKNACNAEVPPPRVGDVLLSPRKARSGASIRLTANVGCVSRESSITNDIVVSETRDTTFGDIKKPLQHHQEVSGKADNGRVTQLPVPEITGSTDGFPSEYGRDQSSLQAPLGIPLFSSSISGTRRALSLARSSRHAKSYDIGGLLDSEALRERMQQIVALEGLEGVSVDCADMLNNGLDVYLKRLIRMSIELVGTRDRCSLRRNAAVKHHSHGNFVSCVSTSHHNQVQKSSSNTETIDEPRYYKLISIRDFKVAMELTTRRLGEDWPVLFEKICMHSSKD